MSPDVTPRGGACRTEGCTKPVRVRARQLCAVCYNRELRRGLPSLGEPIALTGGRWVNVRGIWRWQEEAA